MLKPRGIFICFNPTLSFLGFEILSHGVLLRVLFIFRWWEQYVKSILYFLRWSCYPLLESFLILTPIASNSPSTPQTSTSGKGVPVSCRASAQNEQLTSLQTIYESNGVSPVPSNPNQAVSKRSSTPSKQIGYIGGVRLP